VKRLELLGVLRDDLREWNDPVVDVLAQLNEIGLSRTRNQIARRQEVADVPESGLVQHAHVVAELVEFLTELDLAGLKLSDVAAERLLAATELLMADFQSPLPDFQLLLPDFQSLLAGFQSSDLTTQPVLAGLELSNVPP